MKKYSWEELWPLALWHGRVLQDGAVYMNWTQSGFSVAFRGKSLRACLVGIPSVRDPAEKPHIGVTLDCGETLVHRLRIEDGEGWYTLFEAAGEEDHVLRVIKLTDVMRGKCGLRALEVDGVLLSPPKAPRLHIEFIGDSITCGYGNEATGREEPFRPEEENGWKSYAALTARELGAEASLVCVSGISVAKDYSPIVPYQGPGMEDVYAYTERFFHEQQGKLPEPWNFSAHPVDAIVINLGTNDVNSCKLASDSQAAGLRFQEHYRAFLQKLRELNGEAPFLLCTLGPMDYYLYDELRDAAAAYCRETGDKRIAVYKFGSVNQWENEGYGANGHPSMKTQERMGRELARVLRQYLS